MDAVRLGIIGLGNMGSAHAGQILAGKIPGCELAAVCDADETRLAKFPAALRFGQAEALMDSGRVDAVLIATPHFAHVPLGIAALARGLHVLVEKPIAVHKADALCLLAAAASAKTSGTSSSAPPVFAAMFNQRTDPRYRRLRALLQSGELGAVRRIAWTVTDWFRTHAYYQSGGWRATWAGEGGGVLLNQCPHNLDLWWWLFGQPAKVRAFCGLGRRHPIEVEDEVSAYLEYTDGTTGVFVTSTGEAPGVNRLEVAAERGRVVLEAGTLSYWRNSEPASEFSRQSLQGFARPETWEVRLPADGGAGGQHNEILANFVAAIREGTPLLAPGAEGLHSVELANAMILSSMREKTVSLPMDADEYSRLLDELIATSTYVKPAPTTTAPATDFSQSFGR